MAEVTAQLWLAPIAPTRVPTPLPGFAYPPYGYPPVRLRCRALAGDGHAWCPAQQAPKQGTASLRLRRVTRWAMPNPNRAGRPGDVQCRRAGAKLGAGTAAGAHGGWVHTGGRSVSGP